MIGRIVETFGCRPRRFWIDIPRWLLRAFANRGFMGGGFTKNCFFRQTRRGESGLKQESAENDEAEAVSTEFHQVPKRQIGDSVLNLLLQIGRDCSWVLLV